MPKAAPAPSPASELGAMLVAAVTAVAAVWLFDQWARAREAERVAVELKRWNDGWTAGEAFGRFAAAHAKPCGCEDEPEAATSSTSYDPTLAAEGG